MQKVMVVSAALFCVLATGVACSSRGQEPIDPIDEPRGVPPSPAPEPTPVPSPVPAPPSSPELGFSLRFDGDWVVDQPGRAGYERTWYAFRWDGSVERGSSEYPGCPLSGRQCVTGIVADAANTIHCEFGDTWRSLGDAILRVDGRCTDGTPREIELSFPTSTADDRLGVVPSELRVAGEATWQHDPIFPKWRFTRCHGGAPIVAACEP